MAYSETKVPRTFSPAAVVAAVVALVTACMVALLVWKAVDARRNALAQGERDIRNFAHSLAEHASHSIQAVDVAMNGMVDLLKYQKPRPDRFNAYLRKTVDAFPQIQEIGVLDAQGTALYSSTDVPLPRFSSDFDYFTAHRRSVDLSLHISEPMPSRLNGRPVVTVSRRISDPDGNFAGVLFAAIETEFFDEFYKAFKFGTNAGITLMRRDGVVLAHWPDGKWVQPISDSFKATLQRSTSGYRRTQSPFDGLTKYLGFEVASLYPIVVTVALPEEDVLAGWREDLRYDAIAGLILLGSVILLAVLLSSQLRKQTRIENSLREREAHYRLLAENVADIVIRFGRDGTMLYVSQSVEPVLGLTEGDLVGKSCFDFVYPDDLADVLKATSELTDWNSSRKVVFRTHRVDKSIVWMEANFKLAGTAKDHQSIEVVAVLRDVTQRILMEDELNSLNFRLSELATTDGLTGLPNRRSFDAALPREFRDRTQISVIMLDIDNFKGFNDSLGHQAGDDCLKRVANVIAEATANTAALAARYGGEEFAIVLPEIDEAGARKVAEAIRLTLRSLAIANPASDRGILSISLGVAGRAPDMADEDALLRAADFALYEAKRSGRNRTVAHSQLAAIIPQGGGNVPEIKSENKRLAEHSF